ncbi:hypothetical protein PGT21_013275 [Puccinia graminis f. sp. tritici]|uniref:Uncharacterized protein n=1 Tax=Puccinia graminis f. sp. tritici TaxID=56615 RepID=A0A5B0LS19_PUCGR|nr:hypothetical protein PGTUg99_021260 [Puccinia graminis f. sp. tritici]KAA1071625.1 hypothetical protein PGT21_013275 [Puccinia graminis f. sp. tritici]
MTSLPNHTSFWGDGSLEFFGSQSSAYMVGQGPELPRPVLPGNTRRLRHPSATGHIAAAESAGQVDAVFRTPGVPVTYSNPL